MASLKDLLSTCHQGTQNQNLRHIYFRRSSWAAIQRPNYSNNAYGGIGNRFGRKAKNMIESSEYEKVFSQTSHLAADSKAAGRWESNHGGEYFAAGVGGAITGRGADLTHY
jgi:hypothetical protein